MANSASCVSFVNIQSYNHQILPLRDEQTSHSGSVVSQHNNYLALPPKTTLGIEHNKNSLLQLLRNDFKLYYLNKMSSAQEAMYLDPDWIKRYSRLKQKQFVFM